MLWCISQGSDWGIWRGSMILNKSVCGFIDGVLTLARGHIPDFMVWGTQCYLSNLFLCKGVLGECQQGISESCIIMLFWTTGNDPICIFPMIVIFLWFVNIAKTITWVLWINANSGFFIFLHWNPRGSENHKRPPCWSRTTGSQTFLFHICLLVGLKFPLGWEI